MTTIPRPMPQTVEGGTFSAFQQDILTILADESRYGLAVKRELERLYGEEVNHGRLYPNLDALVEMGCVEKSELDKRTNEYELTSVGRSALVDLIAYRAGALDLAVQSTRDGEGGDSA